MVYESWSIVGLSAHSPRGANNDDSLLQALYRGRVTIMVAAPRAPGGQLVATVASIRGASMNCPIYIQEHDQTQDILERAAPDSGHHEPISRSHHQSRVGMNRLGLSGVARHAVAFSA